MSNVTGAAQISTIKVVGATGGAPIDSNALANAASNWNLRCAGYANPVIQMSGTADLTAQVNFWDGRNDGRIPDCYDRCGCTKVTTTSGKISGVMVHVFKQDVMGGDCTAAYTDILTHELGHAQGLDDASDPSCNGLVMSTLGGAITAAECAAADNNFRTQWEYPNGSDNDEDPIHCY